MNLIEIYETAIVSKDYSVFKSAIDKQMNGTPETVISTNEFKLINIALVNIGGSFKFAKYVNGYYEYADNTEKGDMYNNVVTGRLMTEKQIFNEWLKLNNL